MKLWKIKFEKKLEFENYLRIEVLKIKFKNWSFGNQDFELIFRS